MTLRLRAHEPDAEGVVIDVTPESAGWSHVGFRVVRLAPGARYAGGEADGKSASFWQPAARRSRPGS